MKTTLTVVLLFLFAQSICSALDPKRSLTQYDVDVWTEEDGLPFNAVQNFVQTLDGYIWIGTEKGLARFDGIRFTTFDKSQTGLDSNSISSVNAASDGSLWITAANGIVRLNQGKFERIRPPGGEPASPVNWAFADSKGGIWMSYAGGYQRYFQGKFQMYPNKSGAGLCEDRAGVIWTSGVLSRFENDSFKPILSFPKTRVVDCAADPRDGLWLITDTGLIRIRDEKWTRVPFEEKINTDTSAPIYVDSHGAIWIGMWGKGILRLYQDKVERLTAEHGLPATDIFRFLEDRQGNMWIATITGGLIRLSEGRFLKLTSLDGISSNLTSAILQDREGAIWIGTRSGKVDVIRGGELYHVPLKENSGIYCIYQDRSGNIWFGLDGEGAAKFEEGEITYFDKSTGLGNTVQDILQDRTGRIWFAHDRIGWFQDGRFWHFEEGDRICREGARHLFEDSRGRMWFGSGHGFMVLENGNYSCYTKKDGLGSDDVFEVYEDREGNIWTGSYDGGLSLFRENRFVTIRKKDGLCDDVVGEIVEGNDDSLWLTTKAGLCRADKKDLLNFADGKIRSVRTTVYSKADGIEDLLASPNPSAWKMRDGTLWLTSRKGIVIVDPKNIPVNKTPPNVIIESLVVDEKSIHAPEELIENRKAVALPPGKKKLEIRYTALDLRSPEAVRFRYRLDGVDSDWVDAGDRRVVYYTNVAYGDYRFRVSAQNADGYWNEKGSELAITIRPFLWQMWQVQAGSAFLLLLGVAGAYRRRTRIIRIQTRMQAELQAARDVQMSILPQEDPVVPGFEISGLTTPAHEVGGDFFDFIWFDQNHQRFGIVIGDVSGKSMKAAMMAVLSSGMLTYGSEELESLPAVLERLNRLIFRKTDHLVFTAMCLAVLDTRTKDFTFSNAGLNEPLLYSMESVRYLSMPGQFPLGALQDSRYEESTVRLKSGDVVLLYTDGITEASNKTGEMLSYHRLLEIVNTIDSKLPASKIKDEILNRVKAFAGDKKQEDDLTLVVIKVL